MKIFLRCLGIYVIVEFFIWLIVALVKYDINWLATASVDARGGWLAAPLIVLAWLVALLCLDI